MSVNKFIGIGNLTKDPDVRYLANGDAVANCSIACNEKFKNKDGEKQEHVEFVNLVIYRRLAEIAGEYLKKGSQVYIEGKMRTRKWQTKEGQDRYTTEVMVNELVMLGGKRESVGSDKPQQETAPKQTTRPVRTDLTNDNFDDDIPF